MIIFACPVSLLSGQVYILREGKMERPDLHRVIQRLVDDHDREAGKIFFEYYHPKLIDFARVFVRNLESAEDVVSEVFVKLFKQPNKLKKVRDLNMYVFKSVKNQCFTYLKKANQKTLLDFEDIVLDDYCIHQVNPENELITSEIKSILENLINGLPPRRRMVYSLIMDEQLKYKDVAKLLNISVKTVDNQFSAATKLIKNAMRRYLIESEKSNIQVEKSSPNRKKFQ